MRTKYSVHRRKIEIVNKSDTIFSKINALSIVALVVITGLYAWQTYRLSNIASEQMILSAEPNIDLESDNFSKLEDGKVKFELINLSPVGLKTIRLYSNYYTHLIDSNLNEYTLFRGIKRLSPDFHIQKLEGNTKAPIEFDYKVSGLTNKKDSLYFYIGIPPAVKRYSIDDINKFSNITYAEYRIDFQREIDGKDYSRTFYYIIALPTDPQRVRFIRQTKEDIINEVRELARVLQLIKSPST